MGCGAGCAGCLPCPLRLRVSWPEKIDATPAREDDAPQCRGDIPSHSKSNGSAAESIAYGMAYDKVSGMTSGILASVPPYRPPPTWAEYLWMSGCVFAHPWMLFAISLRKRDAPRSDTGRTGVPTPDNVVSSREVQRDHLLSKGPRGVSSLLPRAALTQEAATTYTPYSVPVFVLQPVDYRPTRGLHADILVVRHARLVARVRLSHSRPAHAKPRAISHHAYTRPPRVPRATCAKGGKGNSLVEVW